MTLANCTDRKRRISRTRHNITNRQPDMFNSPGGSATDALKSRKVGLVFSTTWDVSFLRSQQYFAGNNVTRAEQLGNRCRRWIGRARKRFCGSGAPTCKTGMLGKSDSQVQPQATPCCAPRILPSIHAGSQAPCADVGRCSQPDNGYH